ncbi:MAG: PAS domain-containing protein [Armatimonadetes bacterium]|nr:PAS domain-containing protein [Armatimonadota bacterium]
MAELIPREMGPVRPGAAPSGGGGGDSRAETDRLELAALRTMAAAVRDGLSVDGTVSHCLERTLEHLGLDFGCIYVKRHDYLIRLAAHGLNGSPVSAPLSLSHDGASLPDGTDELPLIPIADAPWATRPFVAHQNEGAGGKAWMALPLAIGPTLVGVLVLGGTGRGARDLPGLPTARRIAEPLAVAIDNAERMAGVRSLLNDTRDIIFRTDTTGRWTYLNAAWQETFGAPVASALGQRAISYVQPEHRKRLGDGLEALVPRGSVVGRQTMPFVVRQGKTRWLDVQARLVFDDRGSTVGAAGVLRDVSLSVRQSRELTHANQELRRRAAELEQANRELAAADQIKNEFLCNVSHELRTPLAVMLGYAEMLSDGLPDAPTTGQVEFLHFIAEGGRQLQRRILDVLLITDLDGGKVTVDPRPTAVGPLVAAAVSELAVMAQGKDIQLVSQLPRDDVVGVVDAAKFGQVLVQIVENAVKFGHRGGCVRVSVAQQVGSVLVTVTDNGEGIDPAKQDRLFAKFVQAEGGDTRSHGGLGLGLVIARGLLDLMGGRLELSSAGVDQGTTVTIVVPAADDDSWAGAGLTT